MKIIYKFKPEKKIMIKRYSIIFVLIIFFSLSVGYSAVVASCGTVLSTGTHTLTGPITSAGGHCISINGANVELDCQGNSIIGVGTSFGITTTSSSTTIKNCVVSNFSKAMLVTSDFNNISNNEITDNVYAMDVTTSDGNNIISNNLTNNFIGIRLSSSLNNNITLNNITNNTHNLYFSAGSAGPFSNTIYNNNLGNISKITYNSLPFWNNNFDYGGIGNTYYNDTAFSGAHCFDVNNCDNFANIITFPTQTPTPITPQSTTTSTTNLPGLGITSIIIASISILLFI